MRAGALSLALSALLMVRCQAPSETRLKIWNSSDLVAAVTDGGIPVFDADEVITLRSQPIRWLSPPYSAAPVVQSGANDGMDVIPAFSEGGTAGIVVLTIWSGYTAVWVQPIYGLVSGWNPSSPASKLLGLDPVIGVGPDSTFYSPFWQNYWVVDPDQAQLESVKAIFDAQLEVHDGNANLCPLVPASLGLAGPDNLAVPTPVPDGGTRPLSNDPIDPPPMGTGYLDGEPVPYLAFGIDRFTWNGADNVVSLANLYVFATLGPDGAPQSIHLPPVVGTGGAANYTTNGKPQFGALVDVNWVFLPKSAGVFVPSALPDLATQIKNNGGVQVPPIAMPIEQLPGIASYYLRIATNASTCFQDTTGFPGSCNWLDNEAAVLSATNQNSLQDSGIWMALGIPFFNGNKVAP